MAEFILKDQYGKEKTFTHDKIFVQGTDGELIQFTEGEGDTPAVLQDKTITENGTYTADSGFDGFGSVTVEVAGSGGGLPAGGYWKGEPYRKPTAYDNFFFQYNGKRYLWALSEYNDANYDIYLLNDGVYTQVKTDVASWKLAYRSCVEYNGKMHFIGGDTIGHSIWDGDSSFSTKDTLPTSVVGDSAFVLDGELYIKTKSKGFYKWIESSNTWEAVAVTNCPTTSYESLCVIGRKVYIVGNNKIYEVDWDTKICTTIETNLPSGCNGKGSVVVKDGYIYFRISGGYTNTLCAVYKYDISNRSYEYVAMLPSQMTELYIYENRIYVSGTNSNTYHVHQALYEVTE